MSALRNERYFIHPSRALLRMRVCMGYRPSMRHGPFSGSIATGTSSTPLRSGRLQAAVGAHPSGCRCTSGSRQDGYLVPASVPAFTLLYGSSACQWLFGIDILAFC